MREQSCTINVNSSALDLGSIQWEMFPYSYIADKWIMQWSYLRGKDQKIILSQKNMSAMCAFTKYFSIFSNGFLVRVV